MARLGQAAQSDSSAMRTIAVITVTFLPATFLSVSALGLAIYTARTLMLQQALFSTSFFSYSPTPNPMRNELTVSKDFWIYWALAVPLTAVTIGSWFWRHPFERRKQLFDDIPRV